MQEYYIKREDMDGNITFEKVDINQITICGHTLEEVITIVQAIDIEKRTNIEMTMENLQKYIELIKKEHEELMKKHIEDLLEKEGKE